MDNRERAGRVELAAAFRLAVRLGLDEGVCNHFSLALRDAGARPTARSLGRRAGGSSQADRRRTGFRTSAADRLSPYRSPA
jgi:hypothetical protein